MTGEGFIKKGVRKPNLGVSELVISRESLVLSHILDVRLRATHPLILITEGKKYSKRWGICLECRRKVGKRVNEGLLTACLSRKDNDYSGVQVFIRGLRIKASLLTANSPIVQSEEHLNLVNRLGELGYTSFFFHKIGDKPTSPITGPILGNLEIS